MLGLSKGAANKSMGCLDSVRVFSVLLSVLTFNIALLNVILVNVVVLIQSL